MSRRCAARPGAGDWTDRDLAVAHPNQDLRAGADHGEVAEIEIIKEGRRVHAPERPIERERRQCERRLEALAQHHLKDVASGDVLLGAGNLRHIGLGRRGRLGLGMRRARVLLACMRKLLLEPLDGNRQPIRRARVSRLGADAGRGPDRCHHRHLVLNRIEDRDQRWSHQDGMGQTERIAPVARQMLDQSDRVVAHIAEDAGCHRRKLRREHYRQFGEQRTERRERRQRRGRESVWV